MNSDLKTVLDFMLDYGADGSLPNMDGSGDVAYAAALNLADLQKGMTKGEVLAALTDLYGMSTRINTPSWSRIASAISTAEDVARQEATVMTRDDLKPIEVLLDRMQEVMVEVRTRYEFEIMDAEYKAAKQSYVNLVGWMETIPNDQKPAS